MEGHTSAQVVTRGAPPLFVRAFAYVIATATSVLPLVYSSGIDSFRPPKELVFRAEAIVLAAIALTAALLGKRISHSELRMSPHVRWIAIAAIAWATITTATSTNRALSVSALGYMTAAFIVFSTTVVAARQYGITWFTLPIAIGATPNAILAILQATSLWNPFRFDSTVEQKLRTTALVGNPNDVGTYLMPAAIVLATAALATKKRWWWVPAGICAAGVVASGALTAIIALFAAATVIALMTSRRQAIVIVGAVVLSGIAVAIFVPQVRRRAVVMRQAFAVGDYPTLTSQRIFGIATAWAMFKDHPIAGVGPGAFKYHYLSYRKQFDEAHPQWYQQEGPVVNFGEVHSDHLQILAETGLPGYVLFAAALVLLGSQSFRRSRNTPDHHDRRLAFVRLGALPIAVGIGVLTIAAFPLELAVATQLVVHTAALLTGWSSSA